MASQRGKLPKMHQMPVGGITVDRTVFAHRRDNDAGGEGAAAHGEWRAQLGAHDILPTCDIDLTSM